MHDPQAPLVTVVIPCRNEINAIAETLQAVFAQDWPHDKLQVCVVDGRSDDGTRERLLELQKDHPSLEIIDNPQQLTPIAMNLGLKAARGEVFWLLGARQKPAPNYLKTCCQILHSRETVAGVGGLTEHCFQNARGEGIARAMMSPFGVGPGNWRTVKHETEVDTITAPVYRTELLREIGGFDESLSRNQDDELNFRILQTGQRLILTPQTSLQYTPRDTYAGLFRQYYQYGYWKVYVNQKHQTVTTVRQLVPAAFVSFLALGGLLSALWKVFRPVYLGVLLLYGFCATAAALSAGPLRLLQGIVRAYLTLHSAYGLGYLDGFWRFVIRRQTPDPKHQRLSR